MQRGAHLQLYDLLASDSVLENLPQCDLHSRRSFAELS